MNYQYLTLPKFMFIMAVVVSLASCDKVKKPYRVERAVVECDTPSFPALNNVIQKYLLEDYTGHTCTNCPRAHAIITNDLSSMKDTLVVIAIHAGSNARPEEGLFSADYRTEAGNAYAQQFNITAYPSGMINRLIFNSNRIVSYGNWKSTLETIPRNPANVGMQILTEFNNDKACIFVKTSLLSDVLEKLQLCVLLTESGIVSPQKNGIKIDTNYVHNHVLRASLAPVWGDDIGISAKGEAIIKTYSIDFSDKTWKRENCHIVAFIYNANNEDILQVEEVKLVP